MMRRAAAEDAADEAEQEAQLRAAFERIFTENPDALAELDAD